jgi:TATA-box binding protein (TBP) (component of TFIID and TFIIIB)
MSLDLALDELLGIINGDVYEAEIAVAQEEVLKIAPDPKLLAPCRGATLFDAANNLLHPEIRAGFKTELIHEETDLFTRPESTTNTMEGNLSNVQFHEQELIKRLEADHNIVVYRCNYGRSQYGGYVEPVKQRKTNRGRRKKPKRKKARKKQGDGSDFNSQITFMVRTQRIPVEPGAPIPPGTKVYKFKVFRTGKIQLPGARGETIDDVLQCAELIVGVLNARLRPAAPVGLININPVMKNYKFRIKLPAGHIINMKRLQFLVSADYVKRESSDSTPPIFAIRYTRQDTKLSIKFSTPIYRKPDKKTRINIFMRGKVNILGGFEATATHRICNYLHDIIMRHRDTVIVAEDNFELCAIQEVPEPTEADYAGALAFIDNMFDGA